MMVTINIQLPDALAEKARVAGILTDEKIAALIEAELRRRLEAAAASLLEVEERRPPPAPRENIRDMTEGEFMRMVNEDIREQRAKRWTRNT